MVSLVKTSMLAAALLVLVAGAAPAEFDSPWTYTCVDQACVKGEKGEEAANTLNRCKLMCGPYGALWPRPSSLETLGGEVTRFSISNMTDSIRASDAITSMLDATMAMFRDHLNMYNPDYDFTNGTAPWSTPSPDVLKTRLNVDIQVTSDEDRLTLDTDESYSLSVKQTAGVISAEVVAQTFFGARNGIETLSQLINYDEIEDCLQIVNSVKISNDTPTFPYRGLLVDTGRNFFPIKDLERTLDAMAANKLNTLHWHITDAQSFPIVIESVPKMNQYGAYSSRKTYQPDDVRDLVEYGRVRGVRVLPEFDAPAHAGNGWQWGPTEGLGNLGVCYSKSPWSSYCSEPPCGQLNIANENMYTVLGSIYKELVELFEPLDLYHFGGDEINVNCWNSTEEVREWMQTVGDQTLTNEAYYLQWSVFQNRSYDLITAANKGKEIPGIIWSNQLLEGDKTDKYLDKDKYIVQIWTTGYDPLIGRTLEAGYRVIFSNYDSWYLDCGAGAWIGAGNNWCQPYEGWQRVYDNSPLQLAGDEKYYDQVIGGEAALWAEQIDEITMDSKLWPRGAALAERLWTNPPTGWRDAEYRLIHHRQRMVERGVAADRIQPEWCHQNEGMCE